MTPEDLPLDPEIFLTSEPIPLYRLARKRYANPSGVGAAAAPGRWNRLGQEAIYTSTEISVPILERLVHTPKDTIPANLAMMKIQIIGKWEIDKNALIDGRSGACLWLYRTLAEAKSAFAGKSHLFAAGVNPFGAAIPSVIVPTWNVVLYPKGVGFWRHVRLKSIEAFAFDPRLFPDDAGIENEP